MVFLRLLFFKASKRLFKPRKVMTFLNGYFQAWKSHEKYVISKSFVKVMNIFYIHMFI